MWPEPKFLLLERFPVGLRTVRAGSLTITNLVRDKMARLNSQRRKILIIMIIYREYGRRVASPASWRSWKIESHKSFVE
jgi:hypothetical protein